MVVGKSLPWVVAVAAVLVAVLRDLLKDWIKTGANYLTGLVYNRAAASRLLRRFAVRRYQAALVSRFRSLRILFRPNEPLDIAKIYVPLEFAQGAIGQNSREATSVARAIERGEKVVILGAPGAGKSMLLRHLALKYASSDVPGRQVLLPAFLEMHRLSGADLNVEAIVAQLAAQFTRDDFPKAERFIRQSLSDGSLLLLLDGLDEVSSAERGQVAQVIDDFIDTYEKCPLVLTCRSAAFRDTYLPHKDKVFVVSDFGDHLIRQFLHQWPGVSDSASAEDLMRILQETPRMLALARNPLLLTMLAYLYTDVYGGSSRLLPKSRADFYRDATDVLLRRWHEEANRFNPNAKREVLRHLALTGLDSARGSADRLALDYRAVREEITKILPDLGLGPADVDPLLRELVERSGLLLEVDGGEYYQFAHLTLQEYFGAMELTTRMDELFDRYSRDPDVWRETVRLWCGAVGDSTALVERIFSIEPVLGLECVVDAARIDHAVASRIVDSFLKSADWMTTPRPARALAALAADPAPRGKELFARLIELLDGPANSRIAAAQVLCRTNSAEAAKQLTRYARQNSELWSLVAQMGDVAVPYVGATAAHDGDAAIACLAQIATPAAARELATMLWDDEPQAVAAAWRLAEMFDLPFIEEGLAVLDPDVPFEGAPYNWVWTPFVSTGRSAPPVGVIAARIVELIEHATISPEEPLERIDLRLAVPLLLLGGSGLKFKNRYLIQRTSSRASLQDLYTLLVANSPLHMSSPGRRLSIGRQPDVSGQEIGYIIADSVAAAAPMDVVDVLVDEIVRQSSPGRAAEYILPCLTARQRAGLVARGLQFVTKRHWEDLLRQDRYDINRGWQFRCLQVLGTVLMLMAVYAGAVHLRAAGPITTALTIVALLSLAASMLALFFDRHRFLSSWSQILLSPTYVVTAIQTRDLPLSGWRVAHLVASPATPSVIWLLSWGLADSTNLPLWGIALVWVPLAALLIALVATATARGDRVRNPMAGVLDA